MLVLKASSTRLYIGFLVQLLYIPSVIIAQTKPAENETASHLLIAIRSVIPTILESCLNYSTNQSDSFNRINSSLPCTQIFFNSRASPPEQDSAINSIVSYIKNRIKRCPPEDLAKLQSKKLETRLKLQQQAEDWKNKRSTRQSNRREFSKFATESQGKNTKPPIIHRKPFQSTTDVINASNLSLPINSLGIKSEPNSSSALTESNQTEEYGYETLPNSQDDAEKVTVETLENKYPTSDQNEEESTTEQIEQTISSQAPSFESFDILDSSSSPIEGSGRMTQNESQLTEKTTSVPLFKEMHQLKGSNTATTDSDFLHTYQKLLDILNSTDQSTHKKSNNTSDSKFEQLSQNSELESLNSSCEFNFSRSTHNLEPETITDINTASTPFPHIHLETDTPKISEVKPTSFPFPLLFTNGRKRDTIKENANLQNNIYASTSSNLTEENENLQLNQTQLNSSTSPKSSILSPVTPAIEKYDSNEKKITNMETEGSQGYSTEKFEDGFEEITTEPTENCTNIEEISTQQKNLEPKDIQKIPDQNRNYEQTSIPPASSLPTYFTNYQSNQSETQISDSLSTPTDLLLTPETTSSQREEEIFAPAHVGSSASENSFSSLTGHNYFEKQMESISEDNNHTLVKKSYKHSLKLADKNSELSTPTIVTDLPNRYIPKIHKLRHDKKSHIPTAVPTDSPGEFNYPPVAESLPIDSIAEFAPKNRTRDEDLEEKIEIQENSQDLNSDSNSQNLIHLGAMRKTHKVQPGEEVLPMNPNENWKIGQNDTYFTIEELKSFFKMKKRSPAGERGMKKYPSEIIIDLNGLNETAIIDFLKHNLTSVHQNETISLNTNYKIFKIFSNLSDNHDRTGPKNEDSFQRMNASDSASKTSDQESKTSEYLAQLTDNLFNATGDENAVKFFKELLSLNETFLTPNLDFNKNDFNTTMSDKNISNSPDILEDKCAGNTEIILVESNHPPLEKGLLEQLGSGCNKIVVIADNNATEEKNAQHVKEGKHFAENMNSAKELSILEKNLLKGKSLEDFEREINVTYRKDRVEEKSVSGEEIVSAANEVSSRHNHNFPSVPRSHFKSQPRDPDEQLIKQQFSFVNPQVVDNFLDVYKRYRPRHSRSRMRQQDHRNNARRGEGAERISRPHSSNRNEPPDNFVVNLLRELVRLRNSVRAAYASHGYAN